MIADGDAAASATRPSVSVVVPFHGDPEAAESLLEALAPLRLGAGDELIVADNTRSGVLAGADLAFPARVVAATEEQSAPYARNVGAAEAGGEWLLFIDADCVPEPDLLDAYFAEPVPERAGALAGGVEPEPGDELLLRWAATREILNQERVLEGDPRATGPRRRSAVSANLMVRRAAWDAVGGFLEGVVCGEDYDLCWRLQEEGWTIEPRFGAVVRHHHRRGVAALWSQMTRYGASNAWQHRRWAGAAPRPALIGPLAKSLGGVVAFGISLQFDRAAMKAVDGFAAVGLNVGYLGSNAAPHAATNGSRRGAGGGDVVIVTDVIADQAGAGVEPLIEASRSAGTALRIEALARPRRQRLGETRGLEVDYVEDEGTLDRVRALAELIARHPIGCARDLVSRRRLAPADRLPLRAIAPMARRLSAARVARIEVASEGPAGTIAQRTASIVGVTRSGVSGSLPHAHE